MPRSFALLPLALALFLGGCASANATPQPAPEPVACREPLYLELRDTHPDSLSERAWDRLQQLDAACRTERSRQAERPAVTDPGHHPRAWLWMPAMMLFGGMMWLMMGAF